MIALGLDYGDYPRFTKPLPGPHPGGAFSFSRFRSTPPAVGGSPLILSHHGELPRSPHIAGWPASRSLRTILPSGQIPAGSALLGSGPPGYFVLLAFFPHFAPFVRHLAYTG